MNISTPLSRGSPLGLPTVRRKEDRGGKGRLMRPVTCQVAASQKAALSRAALGRLLKGRVVGRCTPSYPIYTFHILPYTVKCGTHHTTNFTHQGKYRSLPAITGLTTRTGPGSRITLRSGWRV